MKNYGLELEFFIKKNDQYVCAHKSIPADACRYLAEARGVHHASPREAVFCLQAAIERLHETAALVGYQLELANTANVDKELRRLIQRRYGKNSAKSYFAHGGAYRNTNPRAGLHIHFGDVTKSIEYTSSNSAFERTTVNQLNIPRIIWLLDEAFKDEIKAAKRVKGEYELKPAYGFEYRSLPATVDLHKVVTVLERIDKGVDELVLEELPGEASHGYEEQASED